MTISDRNYKFLNVVSVLILLLALCSMFLFLYFIVIQDNPPITLNSPLILDKNSYHAGETMNITADICRNTTSGATLFPTFINLDTRQLFDGAPVFVDNLPTGCSVSTISVKIPHYLPPGLYIRRVRARYDVNFLTDRVVELVTEEFKISERIKEGDS